MKRPLSYYFKKRIFYIFLLTSSFLFLPGCAQLPDFASPHLSTVPFNSEVEWIEYRKLKIEDFQARTPPPAIKGNEHRIHAHTSVSLRPLTPVHYSISHPNETFGLYKANLQQLHFRAVMIPEYSWWNPNLQQTKMAYVLQHEQIHFALMEIAARKLNQNLQLLSRKTFSGADRNKVQQELLETVQKTIDEAKLQILQEHTRFDEDTSLHYDMKTQQKWFKKCQQELSELSKWSKT